MKNIFSTELKEVIFASADPQQDRQLVRLWKAKRIRKNASRVYPLNLNHPNEVVIRRNLLPVPGRRLKFKRRAMTKWCTRLQSATGNIFLTYSYARRLKVGDVTLRFLEVPPAMDGHNLISGELYMSQKSSAFLENLQVSRKHVADAKCLPLSEVEEALERITRVNSQKTMNEIRNQARYIVHRLGMEKEFERPNASEPFFLETNSLNMFQ